MKKLRKSNISKQIIVSITIVVILLMTSICTFALPPVDDNIGSVYEPYYMSISGQQIGNESADFVFSNTTVDFVSKSSVGLATVKFDTALYADRPVNTSQPFYYYFDYTQPHTNLGTNNRPRIYVWVGTGVIEKADGSKVGSSSSTVGFSINEVNHQSFTIASLSGGNIQYDDVSTYELSDWSTYVANSPYWENALTYSFRIAINKESATIKLQALTDSYWETLKTLKLSESDNFTLNTLSFGTYDRIDGYSSDNDSYYGTTRISYIRYQDYNSVYESVSQEWYQNGYEVGEENGYNDGYDVGYDTGFNDGENQGYWNGYDDGLNSATGSQTLGIDTIMSSIFTSVSGLFRDIFGYDILGINIAGLVGAILLVSLLIGAFAWYRKKR